MAACPAIHMTMSSQARVLTPEAPGGWVDIQRWQVARNNGWRNVSVMALRVIAPR
jgi:hypothetical protein